MRQGSGRTDGGGVWCRRRRAPLPHVRPRTPMHAPLALLRRMHGQLAACCSCLRGSAGRVFQKGACVVDGLYASKMPMKSLLQLPDGKSVAEAARAWDLEEAARKAEASAAVERKQKSSWLSCLVRAASE
jgi:hypothetical protein